MKIILSPAKKMIVDTDNIAPVELPVFIDKTEEILSWMKSKSKEELQTIWKCNDKIAEQNFNRLENMDLYNRLTPAVLAYQDPGTYSPQHSDLRLLAIPASCSRVADYSPN